MAGPQPNGLPRYPTKIVLKKHNFTDLQCRVGLLKGFRYHRILPISIAANYSSGGLSEKWAVEYHSSPQMVKWNKESTPRGRGLELPPKRGNKVLNDKNYGSIRNPNHNQFF